MRGSALHTNRFNNTLKGDTGGALDPRTANTFNPANDINPTEELLNTLLYNITISALSLGTWKDNVTVNTILYHNTYHFSHRKNLILPYSICLGVALIFAAIAIWSLHQNRTPAADGGFLQVMMATRGHTEMERLVLRDGSKSGHGVSKELGNLEVRFGELVGEGRVGFGTVEETAGLRV